LLSFDASGDQILETVRGATAAAQSQITRRLIERPDVYEAACRQVQKIVPLLVGGIPDALVNPAEVGRVRVALAFPQDGFPVPCG
jgi:hypothetical protein